MTLIPIPALPRNSDIPSIIVNSTGADPAGWRTWWLANGADWDSIITAHLTIVDMLRRSS